VCSSTRLAAVFDALQVFKELVSSQLGLTTIEQAVTEHCRYVILSHTWEENEPVLEMAENISI
jgi:hypothetical protein